MGNIRQETLVLIIAVLTIWLGTFSCNIYTKKFSKTYEADSIEVKTKIIDHFKNNFSIYYAEEEQCVIETFLSRHLYDFGFEYDTIIGGFSIKHFRTLVEGYSFCLVWDQEEYIVIGKYFSDSIPGTNGNLWNYFGMNGYEIDLNENPGPVTLNDLNFLLKSVNKKSKKTDNRFLFENLTLFINSELFSPAEDGKLGTNFVKLNLNDESLKTVLETTFDQVSLDFVKEINFKYSIFAYGGFGFTPGTTFTSLDTINFYDKHEVPLEELIIGLIFYEYSPEIKFTYIPLHKETIIPIGHGSVYKRGYPECY